MFILPAVYLNPECCVVVAICCWAQSITNQTNLFIPQGLELHLDGDFVNEGFIQNQGSFFITGNWKNTNVYQGTGPLLLMETRPNIFNNKNAVYHLEIDGTGLKFITDRLPVSNRLDLTLESSMSRTWIPCYS